MDIAVQVNSVNKSFSIGDDLTPVLFDINLQISMGQLTMIVGPSGCGKTTLISIMSGILSPTSGHVSLLGGNLSNTNEREKVLFRRKNIGFIFQQYNLLPALTAAENAAIPLLAAGVSYKEAVNKAKVVLEEIDMKEHAEKLPKQLSGGQQQRVAIARALVHLPKIIVCDEPTAALDAKTGQSVMEILRNTSNDHNRAVLVVTHDNRIYHFSDRIIEMTDGRIVGDHLPENFIRQELL